jgi:HTH-type transcriptional regulator / antitoxin MqsA
MTKNPRGYPKTMPSPDSGRPMTRGEKTVTFKVSGRTFSYKQPGWWCSLDDPRDMEGQLVDSDNQVAEMARRTAKALVQGERVFVPVVIRAIRERLGFTQREAGIVFGTGEKSFEKYETGQITPSAPTKRLLRMAFMHPELFQPESEDDAVLIHKALRTAKIDRLYESLFEEPALRG